MFDVFSRKAGVCGRLIKQSSNYLVYLNTHEINENGKVKIKEGLSYEIVTSDSADSITFESLEGAGDGLTTASLLNVLIDRAERQDDDLNNKVALLLKQALGLIEPK